jgi:hypothetical protein
MTRPREMMGFEVPGDELVKVPLRDWRGMQRALWRSKGMLETAEREARAIIASCKHAIGCLGSKIESEACLPDRFALDGTLISRGCEDREHRMSALVILNAARAFGAAKIRRPADEPYYAPSREYFSEVIADLAASRAELEALRGGVQQVTIPPDDDLVPPTQPPPPQLEEKAS